MKKMLLSLGVVVMLSACAKPPVCPEADLALFKKNTAMLLHVKQGYTVAEVTAPALMGAPDFKKAFTLEDGVQVEGFYYPVGNEVCLAKHPVRYTHSPVFFEEGYVTATGYDYYQWKILPVLAEEQEMEKNKKKRYDAWYLSPVNKTKDFLNLLFK